MPQQEKPAQRQPDPWAEDEEQSLWDAYWDRFRRQQVDDPVEDRREGCGTGSSATRSMIR